METQLKEVLRYFDLGEQSSCRRAGGYANENYFVKTDKGAFVVKILIEQAAANVHSEIPYLNRLAEHHFPAVAYISNNAGDCVYDSNGVAAVVMHKVEGEPPARSAVTNATMGGALAHLHAIPATGLAPRPSFLSAEFMQDAVRELTDAVPPEDVQPYVEALDSLDEFNNSMREKTHRIIHCDFTPNNCLFQKENLIAVIDWEAVTLGYPLLDLANVILSTCFTDATLDRQMLDALLNAYFEQNDWGELDISDLEQALRFAGLTFSLWVYQRWGINSADPFIVDSRRLYWRYGLDNIDLGVRSNSLSSTSASRER